MITHRTLSEKLVLILFLYRVQLFGVIFVQNDGEAELKFSQPVIYTYTRCNSAYSIDFNILLLYSRHK
jgi:hypothetical protein